MATVQLEAPHFLGDKNPRYFPQGSIVNWNGPLSKKMKVLGAAPTAPQETEDMRTQRLRVENRAAAESRQAATAIPIPGKAQKADPTWAPEPRPAFSVLHERDPKEIVPGKDEASLVRVAESPPGVDSAPAAAPAPNDPNAKPQPEVKRRGGRRKGSTKGAKVSV